MCRKKKLQKKEEKKTYEKAPYGKMVWKFQIGLNEMIHNKKNVTLV